MKHLFGVEPAALVGGHDHGVFAADVVGGDGAQRLGAETRDDVEVEGGGLDHEDVGPFGLVERGFEEGFAGVGGIHLVGFFVAVLEVDAEGVAEGGVERGGVFGAVGEDADVCKAVLVEGGADGADSPIHHVAGGDEVDSRFCLHEGGFDEPLDGGVVVDFSFGVDPAVVTVGSKGVEGDVGDEAEGGEGLFESLDGVEEGAGAIPGFLAVGGFEGGVDDGEESDGLDSLCVEGSGFFDCEVNREALDAGHAGNGLPFLFAVDHKNRSDEVGGQEVGFLDQGADRFGFSIPSEAG